MPATVLTDDELAEHNLSREDYDALPSGHPLKYSPPDLPGPSAESLAQKGAPPSIVDRLVALEREVFGAHGGQINNAVQPAVQVLAGGVEN